MAVLRGAVMLQNAFRSCFVGDEEVTGALLHALTCVAARTQQQAEDVGETYFITGAQSDGGPKLPLTEEVGEDEV